MELKPSRTHYPAGGLPEFEVVVSNSGTASARLCTYMLDYRLKAAMVASNEGKGPSFELQPFRRMQWAPFGPQDLTIVAPGESLRHELKLRGDSLFGFIQRHSQPPAVPSKWIIGGFPRGTFTFSTALSPQMAIYVGQDNLFDHRLEARRIPHELPGADEIEVHAGLLEASATLRFDD